MQSAPVWLSYASPAVALLSLAVATATYLRAGPRVRVSASVPKRKHHADGKAEATVIVRNTGLAPVQIISIRMCFLVPPVNPAFIPVLVFTDDDRYAGPEFRSTLAAGHQETWKLEIRSALERAKVDALVPLQEALEEARKGDFIAFLYFMHTALRLRSFLAVFRGHIGVVMVVELGNGAEVVAPMRWLTWQLYKAARTSQQESQDESQREIEPPTV